MTLLHSSLINTSQREGAAFGGSLAESGGTLPSAHSAPALAGERWWRQPPKGEPPECYLAIVTQRACIIQLNWPPKAATPYPASRDFSTGKRLTWFSGRFAPLRTKFACHRRKRLTWFSGRFAPLRTKFACHPYSGGRINLSMLSIHAKCLHCPAPHCPGGKRSADSGRRFHSQSKIPAPFFKGAGFFIV